MLRPIIILSFFTGLLLTISGCVSEPAAITINKAEIAPRPGVEPKANEILYRAGKYLQQAKTFQFQADITHDEVLDGGLRVQFGEVCKITVKRPNKILAVFDGDEQSRRSCFNGENLTIYFPFYQIFMQLKIPGTIDNAIDYLHKTFAISFPLADLVYADPYAVLIENVDKGYFVGQHKVDGVLCDHLVFQQERIDWQIWIEADETPLVKQVTITYKMEEGCLEYEAELSNWKLDLSVNDSDFDLDLPEDIEEVKFTSLDKLSSSLKEKEQTKYGNKSEAEKP